MLHASHALSCRPRDRSRAVFLLLFSNLSGKELPPVAWCTSVLCIVTATMGTWLGDRLSMASPDSVTDGCSLLSTSRSSPLLRTKHPMTIRLRVLLLLHAEEDVQVTNVACSFFFCVGYLTRGHYDARVVRIPSGVFTSSSWTDVPTITLREVPLSR